MAVAAISVEILDADDEVGRSLIYFNLGALTLAQIQSYVDDVTVALAAIIDGRIIGASVHLELTVPLGAAGVLVANIEREVGATLSFVNTADRAESMYIPMFKKSLMAGGQVILDDADVEAFTDLIITGDGTLAPTDANGLSITGVRRGFETTRKRQR